MKQKIVYLIEELQDSDSFTTIEVYRNKKKAELRCAYLNVLAKSYSSYKVTPIKLK